MTRLTHENIESVKKRIPALEDRCRQATGKSLVEIACSALDIPALSLSECKEVRVACVPITAGKGLITDFSQTLATILAELVGAETFVPEAADVAGIHEAIFKKADMIFMADDEVFLCRNLNTGAWSDNGFATGRVFASLLLSATASLPHTDVLVLGAGKVGRAAYRFLERKGARPFWYDSDKGTHTRLDAATCATEWAEKSWDAILDASTSPCFIDAGHIKQGGVVAAPGVPFGFTEAAVEKAGLVFWDELETGVVTMFAEAMKYGCR